MIRQQGKKNKQKEGAASQKHPLVKPVSAKRPKPWYCFRCGEDGHIANNCNDPPKSHTSQYQEKRIKRQTDKDNLTGDNSSLN